MRRNRTDPEHPLGLSSRQIPDHSISASSMWDSKHAPYEGRLHNQKSARGIGAWVAKKFGGSFAPPGNIWIQINLPTASTITAITTQGRPADYAQYVTSYNIKYSNDGVNFVDIGKTFAANTDANTPVTNRLPRPIVASFIRLYPMTWKEAPTLRWEVFGSHNTGPKFAPEQPLGMENGQIPDHAITSSSMWNLNHAPYQGRLRNKKMGTGIGAWVAKKFGANFASPGDIWIQVNLSTQCTINAVVTQGRPADWNQYVTSYRIKYSNDGVNFLDVGKIFAANRDTNTPVTNRLPNPILATFIRLYPMTWQEAPTLRMELIGSKPIVRARAEQPLGMESRRIPDHSITANSMWDSNHAPYMARLNNYKSQIGIGGWVPRKNGANFSPPESDWIQVKLPSRCTVTAIITQGRPADWNQYVTSYKIKYSIDGYNFSDVGVVFKGNQDTHCPVTNRLPTPVVATHIRLYPMSWNEAPTLRMEILGKI